MSERDHLTAGDEQPQARRQPLRACVAGLATGGGSVAAIWAGALRGAPAQIVATRPLALMF